MGKEALENIATQVVDAALEVLLELKSCDQLAPLHEAQLLNYLKLADKKLGLLINFNVRLLKHGLKRIVNGLEESPAEEIAFN